MLLRSLSLAALTLLPTAQATPQPERPRLVVLFVVDGLPMRQVLGFEKQFGPDGFRRFLDRGATFEQALYAHAHTVTAAGHASLATGAYPQRHGVVGNEWRDSDNGSEVYNTEDTRYRYLDQARTEPNAGTSPENLRIDTFGDQLRRLSPASRVFGVSGKDRGAILPAGHRGTAYMFRSETGRFTSSTYYMQQLPAWVHAFNARQGPDRFWGAEWKPLRPAADYAADAPDNSPWQGEAGWGRQLPATLGKGLEGKGPRFYTDVLTTPYGDLLTLDFARALIRNEKLGQDDAPDVLSISLSSHDYVNHTFGPESRLSHDHLLQLDRLMQDFFADLDREIGAGRYVAALSADHGFLDTPEWRRQQGLPGGRLALGPVASALNTHLQQRFGVPKLVQGLSAGTLQFNKALMAEKGIDPKAVEAATLAVIGQVEGLAGGYGSADLAGSAPPRADQPKLAALRLSWFPGRTGPVAVVPAEGWMFSYRPTGSSHGSPWAYDQHVPLLLWGPAWVGQGRVKTPVQPVDLAPTLVQVLQLPPLKEAQGSPLPLPRDGRKQRPHTPDRRQSR